MSRIAELKKKRPGQFKNLQKKLANENSGGGEQDTRFWWPPFDKKTGKGSAVIRFLPAPEGCPEDIVKVMKYNIKGKNGWFNNFALQGIGQEDPVQIFAISRFKKAKEEGNAALKEDTKKFLPNVKYITNIYVEKDPANPENEGKVFLFRFGPQIYNIIKNKISPEFEEDEFIDIFSPWEGASLKLRPYGKEIPDSKNPGTKVLVPSYEKSEFDKISVFLDGDEEKLEEVLSKTYDLREFVDPSKVKSFEEQAELFKKVFGIPYNYLYEDGVKDAVKELTENASIGGDDNVPSTEAAEIGSDDEDDVDPPFDLDDSDDDDDVLKAFRAKV